MIRLFYILVFLLLFLVGLAFALLNSQSVLLNYYFGSMQLQLSLLLMLAVLAGAVAGIVASLYMLMVTRREIVNLRKMVRLAERELTDLRMITNKTSA